MLKANCTCRKETLYDYEKHLYNIQVWPLERVGREASISTILDRLQNFSFEPKSTACSECTHPCIKRNVVSFSRVTYATHVVEVVKRVREYFDGLCLDCLDRTKPKFESSEKDYWMHASLDESDYCKGCRINHKQPTWYFSFMGRQEERDRMIKKKKDERREARRHSYDDFDYN